MSEQLTKAERSAIRAKEKQLALTKKRILWLSIAFILFVLDQLSKWAVTEIFFRPRSTGETGLNFVEWYLNTPAPLGGIRIEITSFFNLVMAWNTGVSFSMFSDSGVYMPYILILVALAITVLFGIWLWKETSHLSGICYAFVIGGALGNVVDRARFGAVIDFLDFHVFGYHWPAFNVADMCVVTGISLLIITSLIFDLARKDRYRKRRKEKRKQQHQMY